MRSLLLAGSVVLVSSLAACAPSAGDDPSSASSDAVTTTTLGCDTLSFASGSRGSGQTASALAVAELTGTQDVWTDYVEMSRGTDATCTYHVQAGTSPSSLAAVNARINYRGPMKSAMTVRFSAWDFAASAWVAIGDNAFAADWRWSSASLALPAPVARFVGATGELRVRYQTTSYDASDLDQLALDVTFGSTTTTTTPDAGSTTTTTDAGSTADAAPPPPPPSSGTIWQPKPGTSWQWQLSGTLDTSLPVSMYDIDLFETPATTIASLKARGVKVICYLSAGSWESYRPDASSFPASVIGNTLDGWPDEKWLDTRAAAVRSIMEKRMDMAVQKGCDGVEPDNVDGYLNNPGFPLTAATQLDFNKFLAGAAHARNLSVALKNDVDQVSALVPYFDFALNEECFKYGECDLLNPFIAANKAVFQVEYGAASLSTSVCPKANAKNFDTLIKNLSLDAKRTACR